MANVVSLNDIVKYLREHSVFNVDGYTDTNGNVISQIKVNKITENSSVGSSVNININTNIGSSKPYTWTFDSNGNLITPVETTAGFINGVKLTNNTSVRSAIMSTENNSLGVVETSPDRLFIGNAGGRKIYSEDEHTLWVVNNRSEKPAAVWFKNYYDTSMTAYRQRYSNKIYVDNTYGEGAYYSTSIDIFHFNAGDNNNTARIRFEAFFRGKNNDGTWYNNYRMRFSLRQRPDNMSYLQFLPHSESRGPSNSYGDGNWHTIVSSNNFTDTFLDQLSSSTTTNPLFWSNATNKIAIRLGNTTDNHSWGLYVQNTGISLNSYNSAGTSTTTTWTIRPDEYITRNITVSASDLSVEAGRTTVGALYKSVDYDIAQISGYTPVSVTLSAEFSSARYYPILVVNAAKTKIYFRLYNSTTATAWTTTTNGQITVLYKKN